MKYYLIAGEASGDLHASNLMKELQVLDPEADFRFFGGDLMQAVGGTLVRHYRDMAFMGVMPVLKNLDKILNNMRVCKKDIRAYKPDIVILIDYPGFNLKIASFVKRRLRIPVHYYISPKIWAWKRFRIKSIRKNIERMYCILPFEKDFYLGMSYKIDYVGNPLVDSIDDYKKQLKENPINFREEEGLPNKPILGILAGSRKQEIKDNLPTMLDVASHFPKYQPVIAGAPGIDPDYYKRYTGSRYVKIVFNRTYDLLEHADAALVTSGTATLETALFKVPQVVCYDFPGGKAVNFIFKYLFHIPYISLVNLIATQAVVKELFGALFTEKGITEELQNILNHRAYRNAMLAGYDEVIRRMGNPGASKRTAELIYQSLMVKKKQL